MLCPRCHRTYPDTETRCHFDQEPLTNARRIDFVRAGRTRHIGAILGNRFQIRGFIGQGGTSRVYLAEDLQTQEPVALKILEPPWAHDKIARERFLQEARATSLIEHPGVVRIGFVGQRGDGTPYIAMEYLFGESLATYLERLDVMDVDVGIPVLRELASALDAAHAQGVIHRDVKPDNIFLLGEPGDPYAVKLVDFGFAKLRDSTITAAGTAIGSVGFMAPEQCVADNVDPRTDVYGLGVVAYRMFTGTLPFGEAPTEEVLGKHLAEPCIPPIELVPTFDANLSAVIAKCLRKDPAHRYDSMGALIADLDAASEGVRPRAADDVPDTEDRYEPRGPFARLVARALYRKIGLPMPSSLA
ncbi:MAG: serine/threonine protein kinase [Polyangiaceae bacterium]|nr:serine/threonine protein kinase [Polyangiaceae bacterium]